MQEHHRHQLWLLAISSAIFLTSLQSTSFWDQDEGYFATTAAEMHARGDWIVPTFNEEMFGHKPPFMYWMMMCGYQLFGTNEFAARFFTGLFGVATCLLTYQIGRRLFNAQVGWWSGLILSSGLMFSVASRAATPDTFLTFFASLSIYLFAIWGPFRKPTGENQNASILQSQASVRWGHYAIIYAVMGLATLTKGPIGFLFPMAVIGLYLLCTTPVRASEPSSKWKNYIEALRPFGPVNFFKTVWRMRILTAIAAILLVSGPWFIAVGIKTNGAFLEEFFGVHHYRRFSTPMDSHQGPMIYYVVSILVGMFPWSIFAIPTLMLVVKQIRQKSTHSSALLLMSCWSAVYVGIFSLASTKLPNYILPAYPALAVLGAYFFQYWIENPSKVHRAWPRISLAFLPVVGIGTAIVFPVAGSWQWDGQTFLDRVGLASNVQSHLIWAGLVGIPAVIGGIAAYVLSEQKQIATAMKVYSIASVLTIFGVWNYAAPQIARYQVCAQVGKSIQMHSQSKETKVASWGYFQPSLKFYVGNKVERLSGVEDAEEFLEDPHSVLVIASKRLEKFNSQQMESVEIIQEFQRFPERGSILVLRPKQQRIRVASTETSATQ